MDQFDCFDIVGDTGMRHGYILKENGEWVYHRDGMNRRNSGGEAVQDDKFTLFRNNQYPDDDQLYAGQQVDGIKARIDWEKREVKTATGVTLKLEPNNVNY